MQDMEVLQSLAAVTLALWRAKDRFTLGEHLVLMAVAEHTFAHGRDAAALSFDALMESTGLSRTAVSEAAQSLDRAGIIQRTPQQGRKPHLYRINLEALGDPA